MLKPFIYAVAFFTVLIIGFSYAVSETHEPTERWEPRFGYKACMSIQSFVPRMEEYGGELLSSGPIPGGTVISVMGFPDNSFGVFIYDSVSGFICNISTGWFAEPGITV